MIEEKKELDFDWVLVNELAVGALPKKNKHLKSIGINSLKNGNIPSINNLITGNKISLEKILNNLIPIS